MKIDPSKRLPEHTRPKFTMLERVALPLASMTPYVYVPQAGCVCVCVLSYFIESGAFPAIIARTSLNRFANVFHVHF